ncbi:MAG: DUF1501 domain-containing protein [Pirellulaceae bacterium]|jgi:uncharacterized protein (DUF1501 family)|nr:DUF1501 domain-containing protein [Pirellulaceae bacterium]MDP7301921.1 DUF1501 domain-containing protein [Pirellulaceae bacterium]HJN12733.1 DUF1501 domain-containing protein [Pirellulaceae bacterium]
MNDSTLIRCSQGGWRRRDFLRAAAAGKFALAAGVPTFLGQLSAAAEKESDRILVVFQFSGGNDGLSTVVPHGIDDYYKARPRLAIPKEKVLPIDDTIGMVETAAPFKKMFDEGNATIVQAVGYPNANRSHFVSMDYWHTGVNTSPVPPTGWIGRTMDTLDSDGDETRAILHIGTARNLAVEGSRHRPISFREAGNFGWAGPKDGEEAFERMNKQGKDGAGPLDFIRSTAMDAVAASKEIRRAVNDYRTPIKWPTGPGGPTKAAEDLHTVAALINANFPARVYYVSQGGFDTHFGQKNTHPGLMSQWSQAVKAFHDDLVRLKQDHRVLMLTFSEFGRRVKENLSQGTDHGVAAPVFVYGSPVAGGVVGDHPSLTDLDKGDLKHTTDFRSIYAEIASNWMGADPAQVVGEKFPPLSLLG